MTGWWKPKKPRNDWEQDKQDRQDHYLETHSDTIPNPKRWKELNNQADCQASGCDNEAVHHESPADQTGKSGWCLGHWFGGSDDNE